MQCTHQAPVTLAQEAESGDCLFCIRCSDRQVSRGDVSAGLDHVVEAGILVDGTEKGCKLLGDFAMPDMAVSPVTE